MTYPNASSGVKKIFTGEILCLIGAVASCIGFLLLAITLASAASATDNTGYAVAGVAGIGTAFFLLAGVIVTLVGAIMALIGLMSASKDHKYFKYSFYCVIITIVLSAATGALSAYPNIQSFATALSSGANLASTLLVIEAIIDIAKQFNKEDLAQKGKSQLVMILVIQLLTFIGNYVGTATSTIMSYMDITTDKRNAVKEAITAWVNWEKETKTSRYLNKLSWNKNNYHLKGFDDWYRNET